MTRNKQLVVDRVHGDCLRACWTSILDLQNRAEYPNCSDENWFLELSKFLDRFGMVMSYHHEAIWREGYWIASVKSKNYSATHAIVMKFDKVEWDPSTAKRYRRGTKLRSVKYGGVVTGGWWLEISDASKLKDYLLFQQQEKNT